MKLATYRTTDGSAHDRMGVVTNLGVIDARQAWPDGPTTSVREFLAAESPAVLDELAGRIEGRSALPLDHVRLRPPVCDPPKLLGLAVNYVEHHDEWDRGVRMPDDPRNTTTPRPFLMPTTALAGPGDEVPWCVYSEELDYEVELAVVIGRTCRHASPQTAQHAIAGYTIANDISARSCTHAAGRADRGPKDGFFDWLHGKWGDGFCPTGPWLVTADELPDPMDLAIGLSVNGQVRQDSRTSRMIFDVGEIVAFCSQLMTLLPGDIIATGTPAGVGKATGNLLRPGDTVACRIEGIGELTNTIGPGPDTLYQPCAR